MKPQDRFRNLLPPIQKSIWPKHRRAFIGLAIAVAALSAVFIIQNSLPSQVDAVRPTFVRSSRGVYIDDQKRCVVNGKLFFPIGIVAVEPIDSEDLDWIAGAGFNTVANTSLLSMDWPLEQVKDQLDDYSERGLKAIFVLKDCYDGTQWEIDHYGQWKGSYEVFKGAVNTFKKHPAILAWQLHDELSDDYIPEIRKRYNYVHKTDPEHLTWQVLYRQQNLPHYADVADIFGVDNYPVFDWQREHLSSIPMEGFGEATRAARNAVHLDRAVWMMAECSSQKVTMSLDGRAPTYDEILCEAWQGLVNGSRGIILYNYTDLKADGEDQMQDVTRVAAALKQAEPAVLGDDANDKADVIPSDKRIGVTIRQTGKRFYCLAVNPRYQTSRVKFVCHRMGPERIVDARTPGGSSRKIILSHMSFVDTFEPLGVRMYTWTRTR